MLWFNRLKAISSDFKIHLKNHDYNWKKKCFVLLPTFLILITIDVVTKQLAVAYLTEGQTTIFIKNFIDFKLLYNSGIAFGSNLAPGLRWFITSMILLITSILIVYLPKIKLNIGFVFIFAGTIGNIIDRIWNNGSVVDFFVWKLTTPHTVFNCADVTVIIGCVLIVLGGFWEMIQSYSHHPKQDKKIKVEKNDIKN